jgi:hypothetical protein
MLSRVRCRAFPGSCLASAGASASSLAKSCSARGARGTASSGDPWDYPRLHRQQTLALQLFASELAGAADGLRLLPDSRPRFSKWPRNSTGSQWHGDCCQHRQFQVTGRCEVGPSLHHLATLGDEIASGIGALRVEDDAAASFPRLKQNCRFCFSAGDIRRIATNLRAAMQIPCRLFHSAWYVNRRAKSSGKDWSYGAPAEIRTPDPQIRSLVPSH